MEKLGIAKPEGGKYRNAMNRALFENQIHMGHTTRKACLDCAPHLAAIAEFREVTKIDDPAKHLQLDHPQLVWNAFKRTLADPDTEAKATKRKKLGKLNADQIAKLIITEVEEPADVRHIAEVLVEHIGGDRFVPLVKGTSPRTLAHTLLDEMDLSDEGLAQLIIELQNGRSVDWPDFQKRRADASKPRPEPDQEPEDDPPPSGGASHPDTLAEDAAEPEPEPDVANIDIDDADVEDDTRGIGRNLFALVSTGNPEHATPQWLVDELDAIFQFTIDLASTPTNAKFKRFYTKRDNSLMQDWSKEIGFLNPPYGRGLPKWLMKGEEAGRAGATIACVLPARTDSKWFRDICWKADQIVFLAGRLKFGDAKLPSPVGTIIVVFNGRSHPNGPRFVTQIEDILSS
jgi:phage N-6-adenine-methyltransferase